MAARDIDMSDRKAAALLVEPIIGLALPRLPEACARVVTSLGSTHVVSRIAVRDVRGTQ